MKELAIKLATTNSGWITRQLLKGVTYGAGFITAWLASKGVDADFSTTVTTGVISGASWLIETGLSYVARKYAVK
jgi:hypothetical protein